MHHKHFNGLPKTLHTVIAGVSETGHVKERYSNRAVSDDIHIGLASYEIGNKDLVGADLFWSSL